MNKKELIKKFYSLNLYFIKNRQYFSSFLVSLSVLFSSQYKKVRRIVMDGDPGSTKKHIVSVWNIL